MYTSRLLESNWKHRFINRIRRPPEGVQTLQSTLQIIVRSAGILACGLITTNARHLLSTNTRHTIRKTNCEVR